jgi:hypothetical protein
MFPNSDRSNVSISTTTNNLSTLNNDCIDKQDYSHRQLKESTSNPPKVIIITKHLCLPCPRLYTDIFKTILIVCKDPAHKDDNYTDDCKTNRIIQQLLAGSKNSGH